MSVISARKSTVKGKSRQVGYVFCSLHNICIDAVVGEQNIADYWRSHYEGIFNSVQNTTHQNEMLRKLDTTEFHEDMTVTTNEVAKVIKVFETG